MLRTYNVMILLWFSWCIALCDASKQCGTLHGVNKERKSVKSYLLPFPPPPPPPPPTPTHNALNSTGFRGTHSLPVGRCKCTPTTRISRNWVWDRERDCVLVHQRAPPTLCAKIRNRSTKKNAPESASAVSLLFRLVAASSTYKRCVVIL